MKVVVGQTSIVVNYPLVRWSDGGLPKAGRLARPPGKGRLIKAPEPVRGRAVFKFCRTFPGGGYVVTEMLGGPSSLPRELNFRWRDHDRHHRTDAEW